MLLYFGLILLVYGSVLLYPNLVFTIILILVVSIILVKRKDKRLIPFVFIIIFAYLIGFKPHAIPKDGNDLYFKVYEQNQNYSLVSFNNNRYILYQDMGPKGSTFYASAKFSELRRINYPGISEFADFLGNKGVYYEVKIEDYYNHEVMVDYRSVIINKLIREDVRSSPFLRLILFSDRSEDEEFYFKLKDLSILHLFVISGFHINILFSFLSKYTLKFFKNQIVIIALILPYLYLLNFSIPSLKAFIFLFFDLISRRYFNKAFDRLTILVLVALIITLTNPSSIFSYSFSLSMLASLNLELLSRIKISNKILRYLIINLLMFIGILPVILLINYEFNFMAVLFNMIMSLIVPPLYLLSFASIILPIIQTLMIPIIDGFYLFTDLIYQSRIMLIMGKPSSVVITIYYFNFYLLLQALEINNVTNYYKLLIAQLMILTFQYYKPYLLPTSSVSFLNVNQGDSTLIIREYAREVILVDTGGSRFFEVSKARTIPYLKALGIKKLDYVVITHDDYDHNGSLPYLVDNFKVSKVIDGQSFKQVSFMENLNYNNDFIGDNNRSAVFRFKINDTNFLLTADIDASVEKKIVSDHSLQIGVLKVSHHGSRFGTSQLLLDAIRPRIAVISAGLNNIYNHPHPSVIERLEANNIKILRTDKMGTIVFVFNQFSLVNTIINLRNYDIIKFGDLYGLFNPWLPKTIS
jgi:competence protein ComEC